MSRDLFIQALCQAVVQAVPASDLMGPVLIASPGLEFKPKTTSALRP